CSDLISSLHSFPTRRSSDLSKSCPNQIESCRFASGRFRRKRHWALVEIPLQNQIESLRSCGLRRRLDQTLEFQFEIDAMNLQKRSEEHTSELQSRSDLVCRL